MRDVFFKAQFALSLTCSLALFATTGCGTRSGPQRVAVHGEVLFNDVPLEAGRIKFIPIEDAAGPMAVATVSFGYYSLDYHNGPVVGKNRIQIESIADPGFELDDEAAYASAVKTNKGRPILRPDTIPAEYNERSTLVETISDERDFQLDFDLKRRQEVAGK